MLIHFLFNDERYDKVLAAKMALSLASAPFENFMMEDPQMVCPFVGLDDPNIILLNERIMIMDPYKMKNIY